MGAGSDEHPSHSYQGGCRSTPTLSAPDIEEVALSSSTPRPPTVPLGPLLHDHLTGADVEAVPLGWLADLGDSPRPARTRPAWKGSFLPIRNR